MPIKCYGYLLSVKRNNLVFLKTYYTEFDDVTITFTDQNGRSLEIEDKVNLTLLKWLQQDSNPQPLSS